MLKSLRVRLTAWYLLFFTAILVGFCTFVYSLLARNLYQQLDAALLAEANTAAGLFEDELAELKGDALGAAAEAVTEMRLKDRVIAVYTGARLLAASDPQAAGSFVEPASVNRGQQTPRFLTLSKARADGRAVVLPFGSGAGACSIVVAAPLSPVTSQLQALIRLFYLALPLAILIAGAGGFLLAGRSLAPVVAMSEQTARITDRNLHERLNVGGAATELARLASSFNALLSRLEQSFETMRRFIADASHELRTPLAVIRGEIDVVLARDRPPGEYRESLEVVRDEARRLSSLVDDLLNLARADAGHRPLHIEEFYLNELIEECCRSVQPLAARKRIELICSAPDDVPFHGDQELLRRLILNLADNAIRYTPEGGAVTVTLETEGDRIRIVVSDTGIGIPPECAPHVFERFYRVDPARSRVQGGFGLGLPIVKWIAESHRGTVELSRTSELGSTFTVSLSR